MRGRINLVIGVLLGLLIGLAVAFFVVVVVGGSRDAPTFSTSSPPARVTEPATGP